jgi:hypothetical protein
MIWQLEGIHPFGSCRAQENVSRPFPVDRFFAGNYAPLTFEADAADLLLHGAWPAPVIYLYLSQTMPEAVLAAADDSDPAKKKDQACDANFYTAELALQQGKKEHATRLFRLAAADCPGTVVSSAANAELNAVGARP